MFPGLTQHNTRDSRLENAKLRSQLRLTTPATGPQVANGENLQLVQLRIPLAFTERDDRLLTEDAVSMCIVLCPSHPFQVGSAVVCRIAVFVIRFVQWRGTRGQECFSHKLMNVGATCTFSAKHNFSIVSTATFLRLKNVTNSCATGCRYAPDSTEIRNLVAPARSSDHIPFFVHDTILTRCEGDIDLCGIEKKLLGA